MPALAAIWPVLKGAAASWQYIVMGVLLLGVFWFRGQYHECVADRAQAILAAQRRADDLSAKLADEQEKKAAVTEKKVVEYVDRIRTVQVPAECPPDERDRLGSRGVRDILGNPKAR